MTSDGVRTYAWDAENRLIKITEGTKTTDIEYDGFHHWTRIVERNGATTVSDRRFIWDGNTLVEQRNGTSTTAAQRYLPQGVQQGTSKFFYTRDHLGSIREVVNNSGSVVARYDYDPYGRRTKLSGTFDSDFGFTGHYYHVPSSLHFAPFRAYSAEVGRWISRDPIEEEGGINIYVYVSNNPTNSIDLSGLCEEDPYSWKDFLLDLASLALTVSDLALAGPTGEGIGPALAIQAAKQAAKKSAKDAAKEAFRKEAADSAKRVMRDRNTDRIKGVGADNGAGYRPKKDGSYTVTPKGGNQQNNQHYRPDGNGGHTVNDQH